eukprot:jgi/Mesen1/687/ME000109S_10911
MYISSRHVGPPLKSPLPFSPFSRSFFLQRGCAASSSTTRAGWARAWTAWATGSVQWHRCQVCAAPHQQHLKCRRRRARTSTRCSPRTRATSSTPRSASHWPSSSPKTRCHPELPTRPFDLAGSHLHSPVCMFVISVRLPPWLGYLRSQLFGLDMAMQRVPGIHRGLAFVAGVPENNTHVGSHTCVYTYMRIIHV